MRQDSLPNASNKEAELLSAASSCVKRGEYDQAILFLNALLESNWRHEIAMGMLAAIYASTQKLALAIECYQRVLKINPANVLALSQLSELQFALGDASAVLEAWRPRLDEPGEFLARYYSGLASLLLNDSVAARALLQDAAHRMPDEHPLRSRLRKLIDQLGTNSHD